MAATRGTIQGNRGSASRLGSKASGITATANTWITEVRLHLSADDELLVEAGRYGRGGHRELLRVNLAELLEN